MQKENMFESNYEEKVIQYTWHHMQYANHGNGLFLCNTDKFLTARLDYMGTTAIQLLDKFTLPASPINFAAFYNLIHYFPLEVRTHDSSHTRFFARIKGYQHSSKALQ